jgi:hypothetical protein
MADDNAQLNVTELIATLLMGLAAVAIAWSTYQSALWGGQQDEANTESVRHASKVVDLLQVGDRIKALDQLLFIEVLTSHTCDGDEQGDRIVCEQLLANMSDEGAAAVEDWLNSGDSNLFESPAYLDALYEQGEEAKLVSEQFFDEAGEANENGDEFELA